jgi:hypothetical protein
MRQCTYLLPLTLLTYSSHRKAAGMEANLHLGVNGYNIAAALFYVFYAAFEVGD